MHRHPDPQLELKWRGHIRRHAASKMTVVAFCRQHGLSAALFHFWKRQVKRRDGQQYPSRSSAFVELKTDEALAKPSLLAGEVPIELLLGDERRLILRPGCDLQWLTQVVQTLEGRSC